MPKKINQSPDLNLNPKFKKMNHTLNLSLIDERLAAPIHFIEVCLKTNFNEAETNIRIDKIRISNTYSNSQKNNVNCNGLF